ncbi:hypothetical protein JTE90_028401 [Oedothorax gibbosus]|uniref:Programmed cell death protein 7 n=1 Tax=Oedothorax gibbosus TaxID=931172 RepID=A0AAV6VF28_9ARAC|nr:hypothetical protein JTE90_028401 [Oedothorax gibbosus]
MSRNAINNPSLQNNWFPENAGMRMPRPHPTNFNNVSVAQNFASSSVTAPQDPMSHVQLHTQPYNASNSFGQQNSFPNMNNSYGQPPNQNYNSQSYNNLNYGSNYVDGTPPPGYLFPLENSPFDPHTSPQMSFPFPQNNNQFNNSPLVQPSLNNPPFSGRFSFQHPPPFSNNFQQFSQNCRPINNNGQPPHSDKFLHQPPNISKKPFQENVPFNHPNVMPSQFSEPPPSSFPVAPSVTQNSGNPNQKPVTATVPVVSEKELKLMSFLKKFHIQKKEKSISKITVAEFRSLLQQALLLSGMLQGRRQQLQSLLHGSEEEWEKEMKDIAQIECQMTAVCETISVPSNLSSIQRKLKLIKKKRELKQKLKQEASIIKLKKEQEREALNQEIDKWLDTIKEKNLKEEREIEMKKEADCILSEVRRKIQEAKRTIEKLKMFEKLRQVRQANAEKKGLFSAQPQNSLFESKMSYLRSLMQSQLRDYDGEERALKVMLEEEQGGRREEEEGWRIQRGRNIQEKKKKNIGTCVFGDAEEPSPEDPLFLFFQFHNSGNTSIESLVPIRHQWDVHLSDEGEAIPRQWVVPVAPSNPSWEEVCSKD